MILKFNLISIPKTKIDKIMFFYRYAQRASIKLTISNLSVSTQEKTVHHITMSPDQVLQEMKNL